MSSKHIVYVGPFILVTAPYNFWNDFETWLTKNGRFDGVAGSLLED